MLTLVVKSLRLLLTFPDCVSVVFPGARLTPPTKYGEKESERKEASVTAPSEVVPTEAPTFSAPPPVTCMTQLFSIDEPSGRSEATGLAKFIVTLTASSGSILFPFYVK